jgi:hypothetical protein
MSWIVALVIVGAAVVLGTAARKAGGSRPTWTWNETHAQGIRGQRMIEVVLPEVVEVVLGTGGLLFRGAQRDVGVSAEWLTPELFAAACEAGGLSADEARRRLAESNRAATLWKGSAGAFKLPAAR